MDELAQAQATLGRSIDRARAGEDPQLAGIVREKGEQMVGLLFGLLRMSRSYAPENPALNQPIGELTSAPLSRPRAWMVPRPSTRSPRSRTSVTSARISMNIESMSRNHARMPSWPVYPLVPSTRELRKGCHSQSGSQRATNASGSRAL